MEFVLEKRLKNFLSDIMNEPDKNSSKEESREISKDADENLNENVVEKTLGGDDTTGSFKDALNKAENASEDSVDTTQKAIDMEDLFESINVMDVEENKLEGGVDMSTMMGEISVEQKQLTDGAKKAIKGKMEGFSNGDIEGGGNDESEDDWDDPALEISDYSDEYGDIDDVDENLQSDYSEDDNQAITGGGPIEVINIDDYEGLIKERDTKSILGGSSKHTSMGMYSDMYPFVLSFPENVRHNK